MRCRRRPLARSRLRETPIASGYPTRCEYNLHTHVDAWGYRSCRPPDTKPSKTLSF
jgi:hypothetical protein